MNTIENIQDEIEILERKLIIAGYIKFNILMNQIKRLEEKLCYLTLDR